MKKALITGITGQDGSYLAELLLSLGYVVHGVIRRSSVFNTSRIDRLMKDTNIYNRSLFLHHGDVTDPSNICYLISSIKPDEVYHLAAMSHVKVSFEIPHYTAMSDSIGVLNVLEAIRTLHPGAKFYNASTSELFGGIEGNMPAGGFDENSIMHPRSPYGCAKLYGYCITRNYREAYGLFASSGILFNHESPRRGDTFVTKKITNWFRQLGTTHPSVLEPLELGNLYAKRDWGHAIDYVNAMHKILNHMIPDDFVIATNKAHSVKDIIELCLQKTGLNKYAHFEGVGIDEKLIHTPSGNILMQIKPRYFRDAEVDVLLGNPAKANRLLGWHTKVSFEELIDQMLFMEE